MSCWVSGALGDSRVAAPAPRCTLAAYGTGPSVDTGQFLGKVVYLDFWASWCVSCIKSFPFMNRLSAEFQSRDVTVVAVNLDQKPADAARFLARVPAPRFLLAADPAGHCPRRYEVTAMPTSYLIDRRGNVRYRHVGFDADTAALIQSRISALLAEPGAP